MSTNWLLDEYNLLIALEQRVLSTPDIDQTNLYLRLMCEEHCETICAANPSKKDEIKGLFAQLKNYAVLAPDHNPAEMLDGVVDVSVVTINMGISMGFPIQEGWDEGLATNMAKAVPDPVTGKLRRRADGKVLKPDGWKKPDFQGILDADCYVKVEFPAS